jgi:signal transduction histidine kinase
MSALQQGHLRLLRYAGLFTWICVGVPLVLRTRLFDSNPQAVTVIGWWIAWLAFGVAYWLSMRELANDGRRWVFLLLLPVMAAAAVAVSFLTQGGIGAILLLVSAGVLPWALTLAWAIVWLVAQSLAMIPVFVSRADFSLLEALLQAGLYLGFSSFAFITSVVARRQAEDREELWRVNAELRGAQLMLAESERTGERLRISRELHDLVGHHLTALSLNLEVASHLVEGKALAHVERAQALSKLLLTDVRQVVSTLREGDKVDIGQALQRLIEGLPRPTIHLNLPAEQTLVDPHQAQVVMRLAQEAITNAVKHAQAHNLWIDLRFTNKGVEVVARDDGRGTASLTAGNGLKGMQERVAQLGGHLDVESSPGMGFVLMAWLPMESTA